MPERSQRFALPLYCTNRPVRAAQSLSVCAMGLSIADDCPQLSMLQEDMDAIRRTDIERVMDKIRRKYGYESIRRGIQLVHPELDLDAKGDHIIHPVGFLGTI